MLLFSLSYEKGGFSADKAAAGQPRLRFRKRVTFVQRAAFYLAKFPKNGYNKYRKRKELFIPQGRTKAFLRYKTVSDKGDNVYE